MSQVNEKPTSKDVIVKSKTAFSHLKEEAGSNIKKRTLQMLHASHSAELHSMINVFKKGSYAAPHMHWIEKQNDEIIKKGESFVALEGTGKILLFNDEGIITRIISLDAEEQTMVWIPAGIWHTVVCTSPFFIVFENKTGPWKEGEDKLFHPAFPAEGDPKCEEFIKEWETLRS